MDRIVIVGAGLAGLRAAETLRRLGHDGRLSVIGDEPRRPYNRPPLSKQVLAGTSEPDSCALPCEHVEAEWLLNRAAAGLDVDRRVVVLADGEEVPYDGLVIATGCLARPWQEPLDLERVHYLRTLDDSLALRSALARAERLLIVGAGFIGCEVAATARALGVAVTLVDVAERPMPRLAPPIGEHAAAVHRAHGVDLRLGVGVDAFLGSGRVEGARLTDTSTVDADLVLIALGAVPATQWLERSSLTLERGGIVCDRHLVVRDGIVAAGDAAAWPHPHRPGLARIEHWTNAPEMAMTAAANLLVSPSQRTPYAPVPSFWTDQYGIRIQCLGFDDRAREHVRGSEDGAAGSFMVEGFDGDALVSVTGFAAGRKVLRYSSRLDGAPAAA